MMDKDVVYVCGSDEHGAAITMRAKQEGISPREIIDKYHEQFKETFAGMGISFDIFHRTSEPLHHDMSQSFFQRLFEQGEFVENVENQYYDEDAEQFLADRYIKGTCPKCGYEAAYGDQCEQCGSSLSPMDLIDPVSTLTGSKPVERETRHWYLPLDKYEDWLREWIVDGTIEGEEHHDPGTWKKHVLGQCKSWLDGGLEPRAMTRDLEWGVDVPADIPNAEGKKLYVWMDAPIGYISATKQWAIHRAEEGKGEEDDWKAYWQDEDTELIHFIGKDNIVFHCLIFPSILKVHGDYVLPSNVPANQFMNLEGQKISTSRNWGVWIREYLEDFPDRVDVLRYYLTKNMPEQRDSEFTWKGFQEANDTELVNNLANFVNRVVVLTNKYYDGEVPEFDPDITIAGAEGPDSTSYHECELIDLFDRIDAMSAHLRSFEFRSALQMLMEISDAGNQMLQFNEPWNIREEEPEKVKVLLNLGIQIVTALSVITRPFMPETSDRMRALLQLDPCDEEGELLDMTNDLAEGTPLIDGGHRIGEPEHLFERIPDEIIQRQIDKLNERSVDMDTRNENRDETDDEFLSFKEFQKLDLRCGTIKRADPIERADKLLKLTVDLGTEERTVVSGIAKQFEPGQLTGQRVVLVANLAPKELMGVESKGMVLMAEDSEGKLEFVSPGQESPDGSPVK